MIESDAIVVRLDGKYAWVDFGTDACSGCSSTGCGAGSGKGRAPQRVRNDVGARVGDQVTLRIPEAAILRAAMLCYGLPVLFALVGAAIGTELTGNQGALAGAVAGLAMGWLVLRSAGRREPELRMAIKSPVIQFHGKLKA